MIVNTVVRFASDFYPTHDCINLLYPVRTLGLYPSQWLYRLTTLVALLQGAWTGVHARKQPFVWIILSLVPFSLVTELSSLIDGEIAPAPSLLEGSQVLGEMAILAAVLAVPFRWAVRRIRDSRALHETAAIEEAQWPPAPKR